ncbi:MAG TPA: hypothetical protein VNF47_03670 [Streptosporangiaceae bacterium]|nr:hypothetical protein [Streptosporangiaceae bacterium]
MSVDCAQFAGGARELLSLLAFELNRRSGRYGTLPFPRLVTGQIAMTAELSMTDRGVAREQAQQVLEDHKKTARRLQDAFQEIVTDGIRPLAEAKGVPLAGMTALDIASKVGPRLLLGRMAATRHGRGLLLGKGQEWYGHQDIGLSRFPLDELVSLSRLAARPDSEDDRRAVAELLWAAFLADLRDAFEHRRRAVDWTLNAVVLLDNADSSVGQEFLNELVAARRQRAAYAPHGADPLTVVAVSRGRLAERLLPIGQPRRSSPTPRTPTTCGRAVPRPADGGIRSRCLT